MTDFLSLPKSIFESLPPPSSLPAADHLWVIVRQSRGEGEE
jgi:hypothetical protein